MIFISFLDFFVLAHALRLVFTQWLDRAAGCRIAERRIVYDQWRLLGRRGDQLHGLSAVGVEEFLTERG
jgi:hypothetical protein